MLTGPMRELDVGLIPSPSGASALLLHSEEGADALVVFVGWNQAERTRHVAIATFQQCSQSIFGYPNDEAYFAVPGAGYGFYEVLDSDWGRRRDDFNQISFPDRTVANSQSHYFMGYHDASAQFLASGLSVEVFDGEFDRAVADGLARLGFG